MGLQPIRKNFYTDPNAAVVHRTIYYPIYEIYLYKTLTKGSMPKYQIRSCNEKGLKKTADRLMKNFNLKATFNINRIMVEEAYTIGYKNIIITDLETGECEIE